MADEADARDERLLVLAPTGRDAQLTCSLLERAGLPCLACATLDELCRAVEEGAAALLIAEEVLVPSAARRLSEVLARQPSWSDLPILLFTGQGATVQTRVPTAQLLAPLGNVTLLDRPLRPFTMLSAARAAVRARHRQYAARAELEHQERAVRERDQFLAMLGHELRNPLGAIVMAIERLERDAHDARARDVVRRQANVLARLVDDLLDVSRVTSGKIVLARTPVDLGEVVARCLQVMEAAVRAHRLALRFEAPRRPVMIEGDPVRLEQMIVNLLTNAVKYTPPGGHVSLSVEARGGEAILRVEDDGVGISAEMLPRVFDLFAQAESTLDRAQGGMGIGLTLVRSLAALHGGTIRAESEGLGRGSTFTLSLPLCARVAPAPERTERPAAPAARYHVLVVEDNADSRELLSALLAEHGHRVDAVGDGVDGVARALELKPDVLVVDIGLPGLDGYTVARRIREQLGDRVFLIALTGYGQPEDRRLALEAGFDVHFTKPVDLRALRKLLAQGKLTPRAKAN